MAMLHAGAHQRPASHPSLFNVPAFFVPLTSVKKRGSEDVPVRDAQHQDKASGVHAESIAYLNDALAVHQYAR